MPKIRPCDRQRYLVAIVRVQTVLLTEPGLYQARFEAVAGSFFRMPGIRPNLRGSTSGFPFDNEKSPAPEKIAGRAIFFPK